VATLTVDRCTLSGNTARGHDAFGGAICNGGEFGSGGNVIIRNSTLAGNSALGDTGNGFCGAILNWEGSLSVENSTLSGNVDNNVHFGGFGVSGIGNFLGALTIKNTILANDPSGANLLNDAGTITSYGYNLCTDNGGGSLTATGDQIDTNPLLGPLANNGGPTWTCALLAGSPAIDAGSAADIAGSTVTTDQRGVARPQGSANDIGAFEREPQLAYSWSGVLQPVNANGSSVFKAGSTVPVKFMLTGASAGITDLMAKLSYAKLSAGVAGSINESVSTAAATTGNLFRYDPASGQYIFNWSTKGMTAGTYRLFINLGDGVEHAAAVGLK
jgi:hypothetical protein